MGYWRINSVDKGQIDKDGDMVDDLVNGDLIADIFENAIDDIVKQYEHDLDRKPFIEELYAAFRFVLNACENTRKLEYYYENKSKFFLSKNVLQSYVNMANKLEDRDGRSELQNIDNGAKKDRRKNKKNETRINSTD